MIRQHFPGLAVLDYYIANINHVLDKVVYFWICLVCLMLDAIPFRSSSTSLRISCKSTLLSIVKPWASIKYQVHCICGSALLASISSVWLDLFALVFDSLLLLVRILCQMALCPPCVLSCTGAWHLTHWPTIWLLWGCLPLKLGAYWQFSWHIVTGASVFSNCPPLDHWPLLWRSI